ncbi:Zinc finger CCHC-type, partial [Trinorchestia longiramus]
KPWQCYKCQRFGHSAAFCRSAPRCVVCSAPTPAMSVIKPLDKLAAIVVETIQRIMEDAQK